MGKSTWRDNVKRQRRKSILEDYKKMEGTATDSIIVAKLAVKYGIAVPTVYSDIREAKEEAREEEQDVIGNE